MKFDYTQAGKWVVSKDDHVIAADKNFSKLREKFASRDDADELKYTLVPKYPMAG
mgnify:CR=1 FL=1